MSSITRAVMVESDSSNNEEFKVSARSKRVHIARRRWVKKCAAVFTNMTMEAGECVIKLFFEISKRSHETD